MATANTIHRLFHLLILIQLAYCDTIFLPFSMPLAVVAGTNSYQYNECEQNADPVVDSLLDQMRIHLPEEKISLKNGALTIYEAHIGRFEDLSRQRSSCMQKVEDTEDDQVLIPFEAEIRAAQVHGKLKYSFWLYDLYGSYSANFSHIRLNGTLEANVQEEWMSVVNLNITSSQVISDSIAFDWVPKWVMDWTRTHFDKDNTFMYEKLAKVILQKEADNFAHYDLIHDILNPTLIESREEEDRLPINRL